MEKFQSLNREEWDDYIKSLKGYNPSLSEPGGDCADSVPEYVKGFFETRKSLLEPFFKLTDQERIDCLRDHAFISFKSTFVESTHSYGHICEENVFSPEDERLIGCTNIALERLHFNYLSKELKLPDDLYKQWRESVFTAWGYFNLPDLLPDLITITKREPELEEGHYFLAECFQCPENEDLDSALKSYETFLGLVKNKAAPANNYFISENFYKYYMYEPSAMEAYSSMARIWLSRGDLENYEAFLLKSIESDPYHHGAPYLQLAYFYLKSGKPLDALRYTLIYEDVFEAKVRSFEFSEDFFAGHKISRTLDGCEYLYHTSRINWIYNSSQTDCLEINNNRLKWRFKKYPFLAISLHSLDQAAPKSKGHKNFFQVSYRDVRTLIDNFCMNIMVTFMHMSDKAIYLDELFERVLYKESYTWDCFPDLKRFEKDELIEIRLNYLIKNSFSFEALEIINRLLRKGPISDEILLKYKEDILKESPWLERREC